MFSTRSEAHRQAVKRAEMRATAATDRELSGLLRQFADEIESDGRAHLPTIMREAARRLTQREGDEAREAAPAPQQQGHATDQARQDGCAGRGDG